MENSVWRSGSLALVGALALCGCGGAGSSTQASTGPVASPSPTPTPPTSDAATGIFVLDSPAGTFRDGNLRTQDFLAGYAWRYGWSLMEPARDSYDFAALDHILARVAERHQKLSWIVMPTMCSSAASALGQSPFGYSTGRPPWQPSNGWPEVPNVFFCDSASMQR